MTAAATVLPAGPVTVLGVTSSTSGGAACPPAWRTGTVVTTKFTAVRADVTVTVAARNDGPACKLGPTKLAVAKPLASVIVIGFGNVPEPCVTDQLTAIPGAGRPVESLACTTKGSAVRKFSCTTWPLPETTDKVWAWTGLPKASETTINAAIKDKYFKPIPR